MPPFFSISIIPFPALSGKPVPLLFSFSDAFVSGGSTEMWQMRPCAHKLCQILYFPRNCCIFFPLPHLQQHAQTENALIFHCSKAAVIRRFPPPAALRPLPECAGQAANMAPRYNFLSLTCKRLWQIWLGRFKTLCHFYFQLKKLKWWGWWADASCRWGV